MEPYSDPALIQAKNEANTAFEQYGTATSNTINMPTLLKSALDKKFASQDNPLYGQQQKASTDYFNALDTGYQDVLPQNNSGMIFSPQAQQEQIQGKRNSLLGLLASINQMIGGGFGGIENIIGEATKTYQAQENAAKFKATASQTKLQQLMDEIEAKEKIRQFNEQIALERQKAKASSGSDLGSLLSIVAALRGEKEQATTTEDDSDLDVFIEKEKPKKETKKVDLSSLNLSLGNVGAGGYAPKKSKAPPPKKKAEPMFKPKPISAFGF